MSTRILVIRLGALGDFVLSSGAYRAIREFHGDAHIVLLTTAPYENLARAGGWFDEVWLDDKPSWWQFGPVRELRQRLNEGAFDRVYDLQTSDRSCAYHRLFRRPRPEWSGIARGCSHPQANTGRDAMHTVERQADQLKMAGLEHIPGPDLSMVEADVTAFNLPASYVLVMPGSAPQRPEKRWPAERYGELSHQLKGMGLTSVLIGGPAEKEAALEIAKSRSDVIDLMGRTSFEQIAVLAQGATLAIGNDTGPMHLAATAGCPSVVLFSHASDPDITAPRGRSVTVLQRYDLGDLSVDEVGYAARKALP
ncbi:MAG: glycosyltransferase family 9 protein [Alphaproteobacteria bacterium]|jgi:ADP-heptose:LPS heptosyltransferase|nr:glycosyltransferase family 9 protein [Rhodospirillaceae bacterium]MDG2480725.1 glycosyltransferase family 9 protein [Alphaproteobacteria bacterium]